MSVAESLRIGEPELRRQGLESRHSVSKLVGAKHPGLKRPCAKLGHLAIQIIRELGQRRALGCRESEGAVSGCLRKLGKANTQPVKRGREAKAALGFIGLVLGLDSLLLLDDGLFRRRALERRAG
jgi:hypothetical protein